MLGTGSGLIDHSGQPVQQLHELARRAAAGDIFFAGPSSSTTGTLVANTDGTDDIPNYLPMNHSWIAGSATHGVDPNFLTSRFPSHRSPHLRRNGDAWMIRVNLTNNTPCHPDFNGDGRLDFDVSIFLEPITNMDFTIADYNMDAIDFFDVSAFADFHTGCSRKQAASSCVLIPYTGTVNRCTKSTPGPRRGLQIPEPSRRSSTARLGRAGDLNSTGHPIADRCPDIVRSHRSW
ncbi:MAG: hypothetical protein R3B67_11785 [Phycisphaerales bacterium]